MLHVALPEAVCTLSEGHPVNVHFLATALLRVPVEAWLSSAQEISWTPWHGRLQPPNRPPTCSPRLRLSIHIFILLPPDKLIWLEDGRTIAQSGRVGRHAAREIHCAAAGRVPFALLRACCLFL